MRKLITLLALSAVLFGAPHSVSAQKVGNFQWVVINGVRVASGSGSPESSVTGSPGDVYIRTNGTLYTKTSGTNTNTGWTLIASGGGSGTVTSVGLSMPGIFSVSGTPITTSGTIAASLATQSANRVWAGPASGAAAAPTFRQVVFGDWASNSCATGQIPKYDGAAWVCDDDAGASSGAPSAAQYLTLATDATLTNERVLTAGTGIAATDGGAGSTLTLAVDGPNVTGVPVSTGISGFGSGVAAFLATATSANLRAALSDEVGTGAAYFVGGALGTPASGTATNLTGLPLTGLVAASDDQTIVSSGSAFVAKTLPDCTDTGGNHLNYTQSTNAYSCGTSGSGGGGGTVTHTGGALTSGKTVVGAGSDDVAVSTLTATVVKSASGTLSAATGGTDYADNAFKTLSVSGQSDVVADSAADTLTFAAGSNITLTTNAGTDTITIAASGGSGGTLTFGIVIDGGGSAITTGVKGFVRIPVACTITKATTLSTDASATSGSIVIDIWKDTFANYPPTVADTITASAKPTLSSATNAEDSTLTGWSTSVSAGDVVGFKVDSATTVTRVLEEVECVQ
jgi:hypothetical protein